MKPSETTTGERLQGKKGGLKSVPIEPEMEAATVPILDFAQGTINEFASRLRVQKSTASGQDAGTISIPVTDGAAGTDTSNAASPLLNGSHVDVASQTLIDWIAEINKVWARDAASTLDLARVVSAAKTHLRRKYGQWSRLWKLGQKIPVSKSTADRLAVIGEAMGELDSATSLNLPRGWNILYCLARLDRQTLEQLIEQKEVHPELTLRQANELVARLNGKRARGRTPKASVRAWLRRSAEFVAINLPEWSADVRELAAEGLTQLSEQIAAQSNRAYEETGKSPILEPCLLAN